MKLSIVVPAFNEEKLLGDCLASVKVAAAGCGRPGLDWELVVCDNASTDATARIAREAGAKVAFAAQRRISVSRNAGAAAATGDWILFIDADSRLTPAKLSETLDVIEGGRSVGGGSLIDLEPKPFWGVCLVALWTVISLILGWAAGSFIFCRADAFRDCGGFPPEMAAGEEIGLTLALKRWGRPRGLEFVILRGSRHLSSGRKFYLYSPSEFLGILLAMMKSPKRGLTDTAVNKHLYDGRR